MISILPIHLFPSWKKISLLPCKSYPRQKPFQTLLYCTLMVGKVKHRTIVYLVNYCWKTVRVDIKDRIKTNATDRIGNFQLWQTMFVFRGVKPTTLQSIWFSHCLEKILHFLPQKSQVSKIIKCKIQYLISIHLAQQNPQSSKCPLYLRVHF